VPEGAAVVDLGCGLGADAMAFAAVGRRVVAVDRDPERARLARHNLGTVAGARAIAVAGEAAALPARGDVLFLDPDRRPGERGRVFSLALTSPSADTIAALAATFAQVFVKAPPALPDEEIPAGARIEFLSEGGECREAFLRIGQGGGRAAVLTGTGEVREIEAAPPAPEADSGRYLLDPDPALRRAGGVDALAAELGAARAAADVTYLWAEEAPSSPWVRTYPVLEVLPYRPRDLARLLAADPPGSLVVKQRGLRLAETGIRRGLPTSPGGPARVLVLFPRGRSRVVAVCGSPLQGR
jgi:SAM-dependent methyltransferase